MNIFSIILFVVLSIGISIIMLLAMNWVDKRGDEVEREILTSMMREHGISEEQIKRDIDRFQGKSA